MRGHLKIAAVERSTPAMAKALPGLPMREAVLVRLVRILSATMTDCFEKVFRDAGLSEGGFHVLCLLLASPRGQASPSELSDMLGTSRANMTRLMSQLSQAGWIARTVQKQDSRRHTIEITHPGRLVAHQACQAIAAPLVHAFSGLNPKEAQVLDALMRKLVLSLDTLA